MGADGDLHFMREGLEGEELVYVYEELNALAGIPTWLRALLSRVGTWLGEHRLINTFATVRTGGANTREFWEICILVETIQQKFLQHFKDHLLDALLLPISPLPAFRHDHSPHLMISASLTFLANMLKWPAGVVPVTLVRPEEEHYDLEALPPNQRDSMARRGRMQVEGSAGLPVGVQVMTRHGEDELCLHVMGEIERQIRFRPVAPAYDVPVSGTGEEAGDGEEKKEEIVNQIGGRVRGRRRGKNK